MLAAAACTAAPSTVELPAGGAAERRVEVFTVGPSGSGVSVPLCATAVGLDEECARTGPDGHAELSLLPGVYSFSAGPDPEQRLGEAVALVDLTAADPDRPVVLTVEGRSFISGRVEDDTGTGVPEAVVCAHGAHSAEVECERSGADGGYLIEVPPGIHKVQVLPPATGARLVPQWATGRVSSPEADLIDTRQEDASGLDLVLRPGVVLSGTVTAEATGTPVEGSQVCTLTHAIALPWECVLTDERGRYSALREPGTYWVWVIPPGERGSRLIPERYDEALVGFDADPFVLREDRTLDVALPEGPLIRGRVTTSDGRPLVLALVCADTPFATGRICRPTENDGTYQIATRPETYVVNVMPPADSEAVAGYWEGAKRDWTEADRVRVAGDVSLDIVLPVGVRFTGTIRDARGTPVEGATVNLNDEQGPRFAASTDIHGRYAMAVLPGIYAIDVFAPRGLPLLSSVGRPVEVSAEGGYDAVLQEATPE